jgi:F420-dependent oxidoreductase-like protein
MSLVRHCDVTGWDGAYVADHFMPNSPASERPVGPVLECWTSLAGLAAITSSLRVGSLVTAITYRHPAVIAKAAATIDQISNGRFLLGLGTGWQANEHNAYGIDLPDPKTRLDRLEEVCIVVTSLLTSPRSTFLGAHYRLDDAPCAPKPLQQRLPLLIGGNGEQRTMAIAARFAEEWNGWCTADLFRRKASVLNRHCEAFGRDPSSIARSTQALLYLSKDRRWLEERRAEPTHRPRLIGTSAEVIDQISEYAEIGLDELIIPDRTLGSLTAREDLCDWFITEIAPAFR